MDVKKYVAVILKRMWFIVLLTVLAGSIAGYLNYFVFIPVYRAETTLLITGLSNGASSESTMSFEDLAAGQVLISEYSAIISSNRVTSVVVEKLNDPMITEDDIRNMLSIDSVNETRIIAISITHEDPAKAAQIANLVAEVFSDVIDQLYRIENIDIIDKAETPALPVAPAKKRNIALAAAVSCMFAVGTVLLLDRFDSKIKTSEQVEEHLGLSVLGSIPVNELSKERGKHHGPSDLSSISVNLFSKGRVKYLDPNNLGSILVNVLSKVRGKLLGLSALGSIPVNAMSRGREKWEKWSN